jgi:hypothetical protein
MASGDQKKWLSHILVPDPYLAHLAGRPSLAFCRYQLRLIKHAGLDLGSPPKRPEASNETLSCIASRTAFPVSFP